MSSLSIASTWPDRPGSGRPCVGRHEPEAVGRDDEMAAVDDSVSADVGRRGPRPEPRRHVAKDGERREGAVAGLQDCRRGVSQDDNSIAGTFAQGGKPLPLTFARATTETAWAIPEPPRPMAADARAVFEVATIKPSMPDRPGKLFTVRGAPGPHGERHGHRSGRLRLRPARAAGHGRTVLDGERETFEAPGGPGRRASPQSRSCAL